MIEVKKTPLWAEAKGMDWLVRVLADNSQTSDPVSQDGSKTETNMRALKFKEGSCTYCIPHLRPCFRTRSGDAAKGGGRHMQAYVSKQRTKQ